MSIGDVEYVSAQMLKGSGVSTLILSITYKPGLVQPRPSNIIYRMRAAGSSFRSSARCCRWPNYRAELTTQSYSYFYRFRHDFWVWRALVGVMTLFTTILVVITCIDMKWWLEGPTFAHFLLKENVSISDTVIDRQSITLANFLLVGSNAFLTQSFFSYRAFVLSQRKWTVLVLCSSLSTAAYGSALA